MTDKEKILLHLKYSDHPLAIHEFDITGVSQNTIGSRLPELALAKKVWGYFKEGERFKRWWDRPITEDQKKVEYKQDSTGQEMFL